MAAVTQTLRLSLVLSSSVVMFECRRDSEEPLNPHPEFPSCRAAASEPPTHLNTPSAAAH